MTGCVKRRSTRTITVLSCLSLTTTPWSVRFGIRSSYFFDFFALARDFGLGFDLDFTGARRLAVAFGLTRAGLVPSVWACFGARSEERRVGNESRSRSSPHLHSN